MRAQKYLRYAWISTLVVLAFVFSLKSQNLLLKPERVFDGENMHENWAVLVENEYISAVGEAKNLAFPADAQIVLLPGCTLLPGLIEGHSHLFLHPYNETPWNDQVLKESVAERVCRATVHARKALEAGFTTIRDLGTEGAGYNDIGLKAAIEKGVVQGPRLIVAGPAIVATGSYGPKGFAPHVLVPLGAEEADGVDELIKTVRRQIGQGVDIVKVYADYRWGPDNEARPTFSLDELKLIVETAASSGRPVVAHASTAEGMRRAALAGVQSIEHGDGGTSEIFQLMKERGVAFCPTLAAGYAISQYLGWDEDSQPEPARIAKKRKSFGEALASGVAIVAGGDVGVFAHGENVRELEMMVNYGMSPLEVLRSATSVNAKVFRVDERVGRIKVGLLADMLAVHGNPLEHISNLRNIELVMLGGRTVH